MGRVNESEEKNSSKRLNIDFFGETLDNPVIPASGCFGYGYEFAELYDINILGTFSFKGTTRLPRAGKGIGLLEAGTRVKHPYFGSGLIVETDTDKRAWLIKFDAYPTPRKIAFRVKLEKA